MKLARTGPVTVIAGQNVPVLITSRAPKSAHAGVLVVSPQTWALDGRQMSSVPHICRAVNQRGCVAASQLRMLEMALDWATKNTLLSVQMNNDIAVALVTAWLSGDTRLPSWYTPQEEDDFIPTLMNKVSARLRTLTVKTITLEDVPNGTVAKALARRMTEALIIRPRQHAQERLDADMSPLIAQIV